MTWATWVLLVALLPCCPSSAYRRRWPTWPVWLQPPTGKYVCRCWRSSFQVRGRIYVYIYLYICMCVCTFNITKQPPKRLKSNWSLFQLDVTVLSFWRVYKYKWIQICIYIYTLLYINNIIYKLKGFICIYTIYTYIWSSYSIHIPYTSCI